MFSSPQADQTAVTLMRSSKAHEKLVYDVTAHLDNERRGGEIETWMPSQLDLSYRFTTIISDVKPGGFFDIHYLRPTINEEQGETFDNGPIDKVDKVDMDYQLTVTPLNEITAEKDSGKAHSSNWDLSPSDAAQIRLNPLIGQYVQEIYALALNVGSVQNSLDFEPRLPLDEVKPGDTWKVTVGYSPQNLKGKNESAVQRLDYTYSYGGMVQSNGRNVYRVSADLTVDTDLAKFFDDYVGTNSQQTGVKAIPLNLKSHIDFDLDPNTKETLRAEATSTGGYSLQLNNQEAALWEEKFKGHTVMDLASRS